MVSLFLLYASSEHDHIVIQCLYSIVSYLMQEATTTKHYANPLNTVTPFKALIPDREEWEHGRPGTTDAICFYTEGSKLEGQVGGGVYLNIRKSFRLPDHCSVFQAEVHVIKESLNCLGNISLQERHINIYSDSQAATKSTPLRVSQQH